MGSTIKTLQRIMTLTLQDALPPGGAICDIGTTQLFGAATEEGARSFLSFYSQRTPKAKRPEEVPDEVIRRIGAGGFLGDLIKLAGFDYVALDIFEAPETVLFDLNIHAPGPKLSGRFDLVMNLGTTEHVINQFRAFQTIHDLARPAAEGRPGGAIYHDLPMSGYMDHALFRYDPLFFRTVIPANNYRVLVQQISVGHVKPVPADLRAMGYEVDGVHDIGIEVVVQRTDAEGFRVPLETSTSLAVDPAFGHVRQDEYVTIPAGTTVSYGTAVEPAELRARDVLRAGLRLVRRRTGL